MQLTPLIPPPLSCLYCGPVLQRPQVTEKTNKPNILPSPLDHFIYILYHHIPFFCLPSKNSVNLFPFLGTYEPVVSRGLNPSLPTCPTHSSRNASRFLSLGSPCGLHILRLTTKEILLSIQGEEGEYAGMTSPRDLVPYFTCDIPVRPLGRSGSAAKPQPLL